MIVARTPYRISFFGGGTDYPDWFLQHGGCVLATTINKYCYISVRHLPPFFRHKHRIVYSKIENVTKIHEIKHPAVMAVLKFSGIKHGLEIHHDGDLPARSGLGTSSSFTVGLLNALAAYKGQAVSKKALATDAIHIEQNILKENVGSQDQISASFGGFNKIVFAKDGSFSINPVIMSQPRLKELHSNLFLCFTGLSRYSSDIAKTQISNIQNRMEEMKKIGLMVDEGMQILQNNSIPIQAFGHLLHETWLLKKSLSTKISNPKIDNIYNTALNAGAIGGKILGAGGGGFLLLFVPPEKQKNVRDTLKNLVHVPFEFENSGSKIVLYQPDGL